MNVRAATKIESAGLSHGVLTLVGAHSAPPCAAADAACAPGGEEGRAGREARPEADAATPSPRHNHLHRHLLDRGPPTPTRQAGSSAVTSPSTPARERG